MRKLSLLIIFAFLISCTTNQRKNDGIFDLLSLNVNECSTIKSCKNYIRFKIEREWRTTGSAFESEAKVKIKFDENYKISEIWLVKPRKNLYIDRRIKKILFSLPPFVSLSKLSPRDYSKIQEITIYFQSSKLILVP